MAALSVQTKKCGNDSKLPDRDHDYCHRWVMNMACAYATFFQRGTALLFAPDHERRTGADAIVVTANSPFVAVGVHCHYHARGGIASPHADIASLPCSRPPR